GAVSWCSVLLELTGAARAGGSRSLLDDREHVTGREDQGLLAGVLDLGTAVLAVENGVADLDVERDPLLAVVVEPARADREDLALLRLLLGGVRNDQAGGRRLLGVERLDDDAVLERLDGDRHVLTSPSGTSGGGANGA